MRVLGIIVIILGLVSVVLGVIFIPQSMSGHKQVADSVLPLQLSQVNPMYDSISAKFDQIMAAEEPNIQAGKAAPSAMYNYLAAQRALLGLAKANVGTTSAVMMNGIVDIAAGLGLILVGFVVMRKKAIAA
ncbi:MAG: hypothetical protein ABR886_11675 [Dehalococcoidales bacterium]|jgi:hypothetical protein